MRTLVVGAGFAGLRAAQLLERGGAEVTVVEARDRLGGRCQTVRQGGLAYEAGGEWIDGDHERTFELLRELGIAPLAASSHPRRLRFQGQETDSDALWPDALEDELRLHGRAQSLARELRRPVWEVPGATTLDGGTLADLVEAYTQSPRGRWYVTAHLRSDEGDDPERIGLLGWLNGYLNYLGREGDELSAYRFPDGAEAVVERMAATLRSPVRLGAAVARVEVEPVRAEIGGEWEAYDAAVLTTPPALTERIVFFPSLPAEHRCALESVGASRAVKIAMWFRRAWWREARWGGSWMGDGPLQQLWEGTLGDTPVLNAYVCGHEAERWRELPDPVGAARYELGRLFPEADAEWVGGAFHDWVGDPWSRGAFSHFPSGFAMQGIRFLRRPHGRIHFAGEATSDWNGFIEGALESAERAAREILEG